jgi:TnpA family transposase
VPAIYDTAYPRFKSNVSDEELYKIYTPTEDEIKIAKQNTQRDFPKLCFLVLLKSFQRLGYFVQIKDIPKIILEHISKSIKVDYNEKELKSYDTSGSKIRHINTIRKYLKITSDRKKIRHLIVKSAFEAAKTKDNDADIINVIIEELVQQKCELPAFSTLVRVSRKVRHNVYNSFYKYIYENLDKETLLKIDSLFKVDKDTGFSQWIALKSDVGKPSVNNLREILDYFERIKNININPAILTKIPDSKLKHFVDEAKTLDSSDMKKVELYKRYSIVAAFLKQRYSRFLDDMGEMFIKLVKKGLYTAKEKLEEYKFKHSKTTDELIATLNNIAKTYKNQEKSKEEKFDEIDAILNSDGKNVDDIIEKCEIHNVYAGNNFFPFFWNCIKGKRYVFFRLLDSIELKSSNQDKSIEKAVNFIKQKRNLRTDYIKLDNEEKMNLSWIQDNWWKLVTGYTNKNKYPEKINRRHFEACVFYQIMWNLKSGDLFINNSDIYSDYREQLVNWDEYKENISLYGKQVELPVNTTDFIKLLKDQLDDAAKNADNSFPSNEYLKIEKGEPVLSRLRKNVEPKNLKLIESLIADNLKPVSLIDILIDTEHWLNWTKHFKNISGLDSKIKDLVERCIVTTFCYGCNLGPTQIARSFENFSRKQISWINQRYVTEESINNAIRQIINTYNQFKLPKFWGTGKRAAADGTIWDMYEQNLLSEYHIRYGGFGALGYYIVSDLYIALFSHFIPCGVWEGIHILDETIKKSLDDEINPETLHADTQGQSTAIFGLSHLLGIKLMPRIRNWKDLKFVKSSESITYKHIEELFSDKVNWKLIETHLPDMLRVALSIKMGKITPSTVLRKLGTYSKKNKLYQAFRELGLVVRTIFLLNYISDVDLRRTIQEAQNKNEAFNDFVDWLSFGNEGIAENDRYEQLKIIKYNHLIANNVIFYNVFHMSIILQKLKLEGYEITNEILERLSPYIRIHINRFGKYTVNKNRKPPKLIFDFMTA